MAINQQQGKNCIRLVPIFNHLDSDTMNKIFEKVSHMQYEKGEYLYQAGDMSDHLYVVHSGLIRVSRIKSNGKEHLVRFLGPGDFTGEWSLFHPGKAHEDYAEVIKKSQICQLSQEDFQDLIIEYPEISLKIMTELTHRLDQSERQTTQISNEQVGTRLALFLADLVEVEGEDGEADVVLPMSRKDIASYLGTTPETISRKFKQLEIEELITQQKGSHIHIHDVDELIFYSE